MLVVEMVPERSLERVLLQTSMKRTNIYFFLEMPLFVLVPIGLGVKQLRAPFTAISLSVCMLSHVFEHIGSG